MWCSVVFVVLDMWYVCGMWCGVCVVHVACVCVIICVICGVLYVYLCTVLSVYTVLCVYVYCDVLGMVCVCVDFNGHSLPYFWRQVLLPGLELIICLDCQASKSQEFSCLCLPRVKVTSRS